MAKQPETIISEQIGEYLTARRLFHRRNQAQASLSGLPDREVLYKGILVGLEVKTPTGAVKEHQKRILQMYNTHGGVGAVVRSVDDVKDILFHIDSFLIQNNVDPKAVTKYVLSKITSI